MHKASKYAQIIWTSLLFTIQILYCHPGISRLYKAAVMMLITINLPHKCQFCWFRHMSRSLLACACRFKKQGTFLYASIIGGIWNVNVGMLNLFIYDSKDRLQNELGFELLLKVENQTVSCHAKIIFPTNTPFCLNSRNKSWSRN